MSEIVDRLLAAREMVIAEGLAILSEAGEENRELTPDEDTHLADLKADADKRQATIERIEAVEADRAKAAEARAAHADVLAPPSKPVISGGSEVIYSRHGNFGFFADVYAATRGDLGAMTRLHRHNLFMEQAKPEYRSFSGGAAEQRAGTTGATSYGSFIPPIWLLDEIALLARAGRVVPNMVRDAGEPQSTSITIPRITTGDLVAIQNPENTTLGTQDIVSAQLTRTTSTIGGYQDVSIQSVELSPMAVDRFIFADLIADYNRLVDLQTIIGTGASNQLLGLDSLTGFNNVAYTDATPTVGELYSAIANAIQQVHTARFAPPDAILMHPRRWGWFLAALDSTGRPLVTPYAPMNNPGQMNGVQSFGPVGSMQGLPVFTDANIPTPVGAGTEDEIYVARFSDMLFMEGPLRTEVFRDIGSANATVRFRVYAFVNFFCGRFPAGVSRVRGTGLIAPVF